MQRFSTPFQVHEGGLEELLGVRDVARRLGVSTATVYRWAEQGTLPHVRLSSNIIRFRREHVAAFLAGHLR